MTNPHDRSNFDRLTIIELLVTLAILIPVAFIVFDAVSQSTIAREQRVCQANLKEIGQALGMYVKESKEERYPLPKLYDCEGVVQPWSGAIDLTGVYPEYLSDLNLLVCPAYGPGKNAVEIWDEGKTTNPRWTGVEGFSNNGVVEPCEVLAKPYYYYGWAFAEGLFESFTRYQRGEPEDLPQNFRGDLRITSEYGDRIHNERFAMAVASLATDMVQGSFDPSFSQWEMRYSTGKPIELPRGSDIVALSAGVERFFVDEINDIEAFERKRGTVVVLHEEIFNADQGFYHDSGGLNVLYLDGHVANLTRRRTYFRTPFPLNEAAFILHAAVEGTLSVP